MQKNTDTCIKTQSDDFSSLRKKVGRFKANGRTVLIPDMTYFGARLMAACFRAFGIDARVIETKKDLVPGKEYTSGKECFPCQVTLGDILYYLQKEKKRLGPAFSSKHYVYFLPTSEGPCRFGMYNKYQRLILDRFPDFKDILISCLSKEDAYSMSGFIAGRSIVLLKKMLYTGMTISDVMDRMTWRTRPYETCHGDTDALMNKTLSSIISHIESHGSRLCVKPLYTILKDTAKTLVTFMDMNQDRFPRIGIIGEIFMRCHPKSNQHIIRQIEVCGGEVVVSSITEWVKYVNYMYTWNCRHRIMSLVKNGNTHLSSYNLRSWLALEIEKLYLSWRQKQIYNYVLNYLDIQPDHAIRAIEQRLNHDMLYSFIFGTEAPLSIGTALECVNAGFNGIVNVYPFTCMPGNTSSAILKPLLQEKNIPYIEMTCDGTSQPDRETALRTFLYQAVQHLHRNQAENSMRQNTEKIRSRQ